MQSDNSYYGALLWIGGLAKDLTKLSATVLNVGEMLMEPPEGIDTQDEFVDFAVDQIATAAHEELSNNQELRSYIGSLLMEIEIGKWFRSGGDFNFIMNRRRQEITDSLNSMTEIFEFTDTIKAHKWELVYFCRHSYTEIDNLKHDSPSDMTQGFGHIAIKIGQLIDILLKQTTPEAEASFKAQYKELQAAAFKATEEQEVSDFETL